MFFKPRIGLKQLATQSRRMATSLAAGIEVRSVMNREVNAAQGPARSRMAQVSDDVQRGGAISDAIDQTGSYYPDFFREMVRVGEESGHLSEVLGQLAEHYERQVQMRRTLLISVAWPVIELFLALSVIGLLIYLMGAISKLSDNNVDILGFGLTGTRGLATYLLILGTCGLVLFVIYQATARGMLWVAPLQRALMRVPKLGTALETFAMARLAWAMHVTMNSGMDVRKALRLSLSSTNNVLYTQHLDRVLSDVGAGHEIHEALDATGVFPIHFVDAVLVGEQSGTLVESLARLADQYQQEARSAMAVLTILLGVAVTGLIAAVIIFLIFRVAGFYFGVINDALSGM